RVQCTCIDPSPFEPALPHVCDLLLKPVDDEATSWNVVLLGVHLVPPTDQAGSIDHLHLTGSIPTPHRTAPLLCGHREGLIRYPPVPPLPVALATKSEDAGAA